MLVFLDLTQGLSVFLLQCQDLQTDQFIQTHLQDRRRLLLGKMQLFCILLKARYPEIDPADIAFHQTGFCILQILGTT